MEELREQIEKYTTDFQERSERNEIVKGEEIVVENLLITEIEFYEIALLFVSLLFRCKIVLFTKLNRIEYSIMKSETRIKTDNEFTMYLHKTTNITLQ